MSQTLGSTRRLDKKRGAVRVEDVYWDTHPLIRREAGANRLATCTHAPVCLTHA